MDGVIDSVLEGIARFSGAAVSEKSVFVCDHPLKERFREKLKSIFGGIDFIMLSEADMMKTAGRYFGKDYKDS